MEALREDRLRKREKEELASKDEDLAMGKGKTIARSEDDEQVRQLPPSQWIEWFLSASADAVSSAIRSDPHAHVTYRHFPLDFA